MPNPTTADSLDAAHPAYQGFDRFIKLTTRKRALESELDDVKAAIDALEPQLLAYMADAGLKKTTTVAGWTIYTTRDPYVKPKADYTRQDVCRALKEAGLEQYVKEDFHTRSLTAYVKALEEEREIVIAGNDDEENKRLILPAELIAVLDVNPKFGIRALRR